jgi:glycosyltransferase involved in cell wall biosynthesis
LHLVFVDPVRWDYDVATPGLRPLGGSQSALCYLARALAACGDRVTVLNGVATRRTVEAVDCRPIADMTGEDWRRLEADAIIVLNVAGAGPHLRAHAGAGPSLVFWSQNEPSNPTNAALAEPQVRAVFEAVVCVSDWHAGAMTEAFGLDPARVRVLRNAIAPAFEAQWNQPAAAARPSSPRLVYTSAPTRGLAELLEQIFPAVLARRPSTRLTVYSSFATYQVPVSNDPCAGLYDACRAHPMIDYVGSLPQTELACALARAGVLCYPNTHPETSSIAVMEAMASGCTVVAPALAALPETTAGFARLVPLKAARESFAVTTFVDATVAELDALDRGDPATLDRLARQIEHMKRTGRWAQRATEWSAWLRAGTVAE